MLRRVSVLLACLVALIALRSAPAAAQDRPMGVTVGPDGTRVRVWAPAARSVELIGDFNGWSATASERLTKDEATGIWSVTLRRGLPNGAYRFRINGEFERRDPYVRAVTGDGSAGLFYDPARFNWEAVAPPAYKPEEIVMYQLHVGTFHDPTPKDGSPATFADAIKRLDYLVELGVNCVVLLPIHEFNGRHSWGYNPSDPFAIEHSYGGPDGFKQFVQACHQRGLLVHVDIVHNHYGPENLHLIRFDGTGDADKGGPYFYHQPGLGSTPWGPRPRFDAPMVRRYIRDNVMMWIDEYRVDGFRWDSTINIRAYNNGASFIPAGASLMDEINNEIRTKHPTKLSIAEDSLDIGNFHGSWEYDFHHAIMPELRARNDRERSVGAIAGVLDNRPSMWRVIYIDSHDEAGKLNGQGRIASDVSAGNPDGDYARQMCGLGAFFTLTAPGMPMIFMGNEFQEKGYFHDSRPLDWSLRTAHRGMLLLHHDLIRLRRNLDGVGPALTGKGIEIPVVDDTKKVLAYWRYDETNPGHAMVAVANLSRDTLPGIVVPFPSAGPWKTVFNSDWTRYDGKSAENRSAFRLDAVTPRGRVTLPPYSARLYALADPRVIPPPVVAPTPQRRTNLQQFSMYASLHVAGDFNNWNLTGAPLTLATGLLWEGRVSFGSSTGTEFRLTANDTGIIFWGAGSDAQITPPYTGTLQRLGGNIHLAGPLDGTYRVTFEEETLEFTIAPVDAAVEARRAEVRTWTDARGQTLQARFAGMRGEDLVALEREDGRIIQVRMESLSALDQSYVRAFGGGAP